MTIMILSFVLFGYGLLNLILSFPLLNRKIKPNWWYGFRTKDTVHNESIWYPVNRFLGKQLIYAAIHQVSLAMLLYFLKDRATFLIALIAVSVMVILSPILVIVRTHVFYREMQTSGK